MSHWLRAEARVWTSTCITSWVRTLTVAAESIGARLLTPCHEPACREPACHEPALAVQRKRRSASLATSQKPTGPAPSLVRVAPAGALPPACAVPLARSGARALLPAARHHTPASVLVPLPVCLCARACFRARTRAAAAGGGGPQLRGLHYGGEPGGLPQRRACARRPPRIRLARGPDVEACPQMPG